jgi:hypothetical protein
MKRLKSVSDRNERAEVEPAGTVPEPKREASLDGADEGITRLNGLDPMTAATVTEQSLEALKPLRGDLAAQFGQDGLDALDALPSLVRATRRTDLDHAASYVRANLLPLVAEVHASYRVLLSDASALTTRGLLEQSRVDAAKGKSGHRALARNTLLLVGLFRAEWPRLTGRMATSVEDLDRAERRAHDLARALIERTQRGALRGRSAKIRARALGALVDKYEEVRDMVRFIRRRHHDADLIAPSLWSTRGRRRRAQGAKVDEERPGAAARWTGEVTGGAIGSASGGVGAARDGGDASED